MRVFLFLFVLFCQIRTQNLVFGFPHSFDIETSERVTYGLSGGRFGDNLIAYLHAKWISHEMKIPLLYQPFPMSDQLKMDDEEILSDGADSATLLCPYFPESKKEESTFDRLFDVDWKNKEFREGALQMIAPKKHLDAIHPPSNTINIAIHVREGGGFDHKDVILSFPLKMPPLEYYISGLKEVLSHFPGQSFYCFIFTDAREPKKLAQIFSKALAENTAIYFDFRSKSRHNKNVLEDFFSLFNFDIMIRPESNFSIVPCLLHDFAIICSPEKDLGVEMDINPEMCQELLKRKCTQWPRLASWNEKLRRRFL